MHGFGAIVSIGRSGILHRQAMHLRAHGIRAYAPNVNPYDAIEARTRCWAERLEHVLDETRCNAVHLIAVSAAGLDARLLLEAPTWRKHTRSLITVSSPNRGSSLAEFLLNRPERFRDWTLATLDFVGRATYHEDPPNARDALSELTPEAVSTRFDTEPIAGVFCASYSAAAGKGTDAPIHPALLLPNRILFGKEGKNDGMVSTESASWAESLDTLAVDHLRLQGFSWPGAPDFDSNDFFLSICRILHDRGCRR